MNKVQLSHIYLFSYAILLFSDILKYININSNFTNKIFYIGLSISFLLNVFILMYKHHINKYYVIFVLFIIIYLFVAIFNFKLISIETIGLFMLLSNINLLHLNEFIHVDLFIKSSMFIFAVLLNFMDVIPTIYTGKGMSLGFIHPNIAGYIGLSISFSILLLSYNRLICYKRNFVLTVFGIILLFIIYNLTKFRGMQFAGMIVIILLLLIKFRNYIFKFCIGVSMIIPLFAIYVVFKFNPYNPSWSYINKLSSNRLAMQHIIVQNYPINYFGTHISQFMINPSWVPFRYNISNLTIDDSYLAACYYEGIIGLILLMGIIIGILFIAYKYDENIPFILLFSLILCSCVTSDLLDVYNFSILLYIVAYQYQFKNKRKEMSL